MAPLRHQQHGVAFLRALLLATTMGMMMLLLFHVTPPVWAAAAVVQPLNLERFIGKKVLFVVAHPDDIEGK